MATTTTTNITNLQEKVIGPARMTLKDDVLAIKSSFHVERGRDGMDDTYNWPKLPGVTAQSLTEGVEIVPETLVDTSVAISASEVGVAVELTEKMLRTVGRDDFLRKAGQAMGMAINVKQDQDAATLIDGFSTAVGSDGSSATLGNLGAALAQLRANTEPVNEAMMRDVSAVLHPYGWHDISQQLFPTGEGAMRTPVAQMNDANKRVLSGYFPVGTYFGVPIKLSTNLVTSSTNVRSGVFHKDAGLIYEFMPVELRTQENVLTRSVELVMVVDYGYGEVNDGFGREWDHDASAPTS